jgi:hypothetical protein
LKSPERWSLTNTIRGSLRIFFKVRSSSIGISSFAFLFRPSILINHIFFLSLYPNLY